jgi:hypothetical protein
MQTCAICEKAIYGHDKFRGSLVCGSCTLTKKEEAKSGKTQVSKSPGQVRLDLAKVLNKAVPKKESVMSDSVVRSNYARNKTILLDGRYPLSFDATGKAIIAGRLREAFEREMVAKPGRYWYEDSKVAVVQVAPTQLVPVQESIQEPVQEEIVELELEDEEEKNAVPVGLELSFKEEAPKTTALLKGKQKKK